MLNSKEEPTQQFTQMNVGGTNTNKETSFQRVEHIEGTPFYLVIQDTEYFATYANYRITESVELATPISLREEDQPDELEIDYFKKNIIKSIKEEEYMVIMRMIGITFEKMKAEEQRQDPVSSAVDRYTNEHPEVKRVQV